MSLLHWMGVWWACSAPTPAELEARGDAATDVHARAEAYAAACEGGAISACVTLALLEEAPDSARLRAAERGCEAGEPDACLARRADPGDGWTARACEAGRGHACLGRCL